jgi:hypothetical protein
MNIAIVGPGAARGAGSFYDERWKIWGINSAYRQHHARWAKMFNLHRLRHLERDCPQYVDWDSTWSRRNPRVPMVVVDSWKGLLKNQVLFPRAALAKQSRTDYHASSFDWLVAYAIHLKAKLIHIHGARFALDSPREEPISARACLEYWCGYAQGLGIKVTEHRDCELFVQYHLVQSRTVYGYDDVHMVEYRK